MAEECKYHNEVIMRIENLEKITAKNEKDICSLSDKYHKQDKEISVFMAVIEKQYDTIIATMAEHFSNNKEVRAEVDQMRSDLLLNDYKTNKAGDFIDKMTPSKIIASIGSLIALLVAIKEIFM